MTSETPFTVAMTTDPTDTQTDNDYDGIIRLHDEYDGTVTGQMTVAVVEFGNNRVSLHITDPTGKTTWVWMAAKDAIELGDVLATAGHVASQADEPRDDDGLGF